MKFSVWDKNGWLPLGKFEADDREGAILACAKASGYTDLRHAAKSHGLPLEEFLASYIVGDEMFAPDLGHLIQF